MADFSIAGLFLQAFGLDRGKPFDPDRAYDVDYRQESEYPDLPTSNEEEGTEFVSVRSTLRAALPNGQRLFMPVKIGNLILPNEPTIAITGRKNIVETVLVGSSRRGTVKELIAVEDYTITIYGVAINFDSKLVYPEDQVKALHDLYLRNEALEIQCALTNLLGIYRIVIKEIELPEMRGVQHAQAYRLAAVSDEDFVLAIQ